MEKELQFLVYSTPENNISVNAVIKDETIWLTQKAMSELFDVEVPAISKHLSNVFSEGELEYLATVSKMEIVQKEGNRQVKRKIDFYNLDAIISVGYRVNSRKATQFRIWATAVLREYITKGFAMDDERLKQGTATFGKDYFRELLERVRSIRASERRIWLQITDIFSECSIDYDKDSPTRAGIHKEVCKRSSANCLRLRLFTANHGFYAVLIFCCACSAVRRALRCLKYSTISSSSGTSIMPTEL